LNRREFLQRSAIAAAVSGAATVGAWRFELHHLEVVDVTLPVAGLPSSLDGARLVQVSDLHVGPAVSDAYVKHAMEMVGKLNPDIVAFTGDFVTWRGKEQIAQLDAVLHSLPKPRLASVAVLGNHDYGAQWQQTEVAESVIGVAERHGITVLRNDVRVVEGLNILGVDDAWSGHANVAAARARAVAGAPALALCHNPDVADYAQWSGYQGWLLCGHTHGGQCRAPFCAPPVLPIENRRYAAGQVALDDGRTVYINRGVGHSLPIRVLVRPEITNFRLVRA
jgi:predicted MPP superfamily phosphohydrolase